MRKLLAIVFFSLWLTYPAAADQLVANGGFETGDFTSWTLSGNDVPLQLENLYGVEGVDPFDGISPHSGSFQAFFADLPSNATTLDQTLATTVGGTYSVSFYLAQDTPPSTVYPNEFSASFGGVSLVSATQVPVEGYTLYTYTETATSPSTLLSFTIGNDLGEFLLDDVSVSTVSTATPEPSSILLLGMGLIGLAGVCRFRSLGKISC